MKKRLDLLVKEQFGHLTRNQIQNFISEGLVSVNDVVITKPGTSVLASTTITLKSNEPKYVCRAGFKLEKALDYFNVDVKNKTVLDAGLSTGGFTDCLLQKGAKKIYGVDVGRDQVHKKIAQNPRVQVMERTNLRHVKTVGELVDIVTLDLSFISVLKVIATVYEMLKKDGQLVLLIKPQFETTREQLGKGGVIKDPNVHQKIVESVVDGVCKAGFAFCGVVDSPLFGSSGNKEFLALFVKE